MATKRDRKINFSDNEVSVLLDGVFEFKDVLFERFSSSVTNRMKTEAWNKVLLRVNGCSRTERDLDEIRKKWKDLRSAFIRYESEGRKTGGGGAVKCPGYYDIMIKILGNCGEVIDGIPGLL